VIDEQAASDPRARVDLYPGEEACDLGYPTREQFEVVPPEPIGEVMRPHGM